MKYAYYTPGSIGKCRRKVDGTTNRRGKLPAKTDHIHGPLTGGRNGRTSPPLRIPVWQCLGANAVNQDHGGDARLLVAVRAAVDVTCLHASLNRRCRHALANIGDTNV